MKKTVLVILFLFTVSLLAQAQQVQVARSVFVAKSGTLFNLNANIALNSKTGQTLVVWERVNNADHSIFGRLLSSQGKPAGGEFLLAAGPNASHPNAVYNPVKNEFLLSYDDNPTFSLKHTDVYLQRLTPLGKNTGPVAKATTDTISAPMVNYLPKLVFNAKSSNYLLFWIREIVNITQGLDNNGLVGVVVNPGGTVGGSVVLVRKTVVDSPNLLEPILLDAVFHPLTGRVLIGYTQFITGTGAGQFNYYYGNLDPKLAGITEANFTKTNTAGISISQFVWGLKFAFQSTGTGFMVFVDSANMKRRKIDSTGKLSGTPMVAFHPPKNNTRLFYPGLILANGANGIRGLMLGVQDPFNSSGVATVWAQPIDANGLALGPAVKVDATDSTNTAFGSQLQALPQPPTATTYRFIDLYALTQFTSPGQTFQNSGITLLNLTVTFP